MNIQWLSYFLYQGAGIRNFICFQACLQLYIATYVFLPPLKLCLFMGFLNYVEPDCRTVSEKLHSHKYNAFS